jgi:hypothetical protein
MPTDPLHTLLEIPPIHYSLAKLHTLAISRLEHLPPSSPLLTVITHNPLSQWQTPYYLPTFLTTLVESRNPNAPPFSYPLPINTLPWSHTQYLVCIDTDRTSPLTTCSLISKPPPSLCLLYIHTLPVPHPSYAHSFTLFTSEGPAGHGHTVDVVEC